MLSECLYEQNQAIALLTGARARVSQTLLISGGRLLGLGKGWR